MGNLLASLAPAQVIAVIGQPSRLGADVLYFLLAVAWARSARVLSSSIDGKGVLPILRHAISACSVSSSSVGIGALIQASCGAGLAETMSRTGAVMPRRASATMT